MTPAKYVWGLVVCDAALFVLSDIIAILWAKRMEWQLLAVTFVLAGMGYALFAIVYCIERSLSVTTTVVSIVAMLGSVVVGVCFFGDAFTPRHALGIVAALVAVWLLH